MLSRIFYAVLSTLIKPLAALRITAFGEVEYSWAMASSSSRLDGSSLAMTGQELVGELLAIGRAVQVKDICQFYSHNPTTTRLSTISARSSLGLVRWV